MITLKLKITYQGLVNCDCLTVVSALYGLNTPINDIAER